VRDRQTPGGLTVLPNRHARREKSDAKARPEEPSRSPRATTTITTNLPAWKVQPLQFKHQPVSVSSSPDTHSQRPAIDAVLCNLSYSPQPLSLYLRHTPILRSFSPTRSPLRLQPGSHRELACKCKCKLPLFFCHHSGPVVYSRHGPIVR
jgi:hypothetical protein